MDIRLLLSMLMYSCSHKSTGSCQTPVRNRDPYHRMRKGEGVVELLLLCICLWETSLRHY